MKKAIKITIFSYICLFFFIIIAVCVFTNLQFDVSNTNETDSNSSSVGSSLVDSDSLAYPMASFIVTAEYGYYSPFGEVRYHYGIDLATAENTEIYAISDGVVYDSGYNAQWYGNYAYILYNIEGKYISVCYFHMNEEYVSVGQEVNNNTLVGTEGSTGYSTGPHLHLEVSLIPESELENISIATHNNYRVNPRQLIDFPNSYIGNREIE